MKSRQKPPAKVVQMVSSQWSGPLPPPAALADFNNLIENGAERIMRMCEEEQRARHASERRAMSAEIWLEAGGRITATLLILVCLGLAGWCIYIQAPTIIVLCLLGVPVMSAIAALIRRK